MARRRTTITLNVYLNSRLVGRLTRRPSGAVEFRYDPSWLEWEHALPVSLSLPLREDRYTGEPVNAVFDNLLPDSVEIRRRLARRARAKGEDAFSMLAAIGRDCVGALQFLPEGVDPGQAGLVDGRQVDEDDVVRILNDLGQAPLGLDEEGEFRISIAGAQEKTALLWWGRDWYVPHGATPTTHILKPPIGVLPNGIDLSRSVENEYMCMRFLAELGLPVARTAIRNFGGQPTLVIERFDRRWTKDGRLLRLPQEDCCQALSIPPTLKYEPDGGPGIQSIMELLKASDEPHTDQRTFCSAQIAYWLLGATDGHAKNFSIFLAPGARFHLTPLYDVMSAQPNVDSGQIRHGRMKLAMAVGNNRHYRIDEIMPRHFIQTAAACGVAEEMIEGIIENLARAVPDALRRTIDQLPADFPDELTESIAGGIERRMAQLSDGG